jgi:hypothetical protein
VASADEGLRAAKDARGAYGIRVRGVADAHRLLVPAAREWPQLRVVMSIEDPPPRPESVTPDRAELRLKTGGRLAIERDEGVARFALPRRLSQHELVHPYLAPAAAVMAHWLRRPCFHAGGFVAGDRVWALAGDREAGKSALLASLALRGHAVVTDDVLVLADGGAYAGPRSIDLRRETAETLGAGEPLGVVGARSRWRLPLPPIASELPFAGWIFLAWGDAVEARRLAGSECLARLIGHRTLRIAPLDPASLLELASLPAWELRRPREWRSLNETVERLLEVTWSGS